VPYGDGTWLTPCRISSFFQKSWLSSVLSVVHFLAFAATVTAAFYIRKYMLDKAEGEYFLQLSEYSPQDLFHFLLNSLAFEPPRRMHHFWHYLFYVLPLVQTLEYGPFFFIFVEFLHASIFRKEWGSATQLNSFFFRNLEKAQKLLGGFDHPKVCIFAFLNNFC